MFCQKCGTEGAEGTFCQKCGEKLDATPNQVNETYQQPMMQVPRCPVCGGYGNKQYRTWRIVVAILCFPIGLIALCGPKEYKCLRCNNWF